MQGIITKKEFKKNITLAPKENILDLLNLIQIESEKYKPLCSKLKRLLEKH